MGDSGEVRLFPFVKKLPNASLEIFPGRRFLYGAKELSFSSIRPVHAQNIFSKTKTVELRRRLPLTRPGTPALIYVTSPERAILGGFQIAELVTDSVDSLWKRMNGKTQVSHGDFVAYFADLITASGIVISDPWLLPEPITLERLRELWPGFNPPRSFRYIRMSDIHAKKLTEIINDMKKLGASA